MVADRKTLAPSSFVHFLVLALMFALSLNFVMTSQARSQDKCENALKEAENLYITGRFDEAIDLLEGCLPSGFTQEQKKQAYRLLGKSYLAKDYLDQAKDAIEKLLEIVPTWKPDPIQEPPEFMQLVEEVKQRMEAQQKEPSREEPVKPTKKGG